MHSPNLKGLPNRRHTRKQQTNVSNIMMMMMMITVEKDSCVLYTLMRSVNHF